MDLQSIGFFGGSQWDRGGVKKINPGKSEKKQKNNVGPMGNDPKDPNPEVN